MPSLLFSAPYAAAALSLHLNFTPLKHWMLSDVAKYISSHGHTYTLSKLAPTCKVICVSLSKIKI